MKLDSPEDVAKLTYFVALALIVASATLLTYLMALAGKMGVASWDGSVVIKNGTFYVSFSPFGFYNSRPYVDVVVGHWLRVAVDAFAFDDAHSVFDHKYMVDYIPKILNFTFNSITVSYEKFMKIVKINGTELKIIITNATKLNKVSLVFPMVTKFEKVKNGYFVRIQTPYGVKVDGVMSFKGCVYLFELPVLGVSPTLVLKIYTPFNVLNMNTYNCTDKFVIEFKVLGYQNELIGYVIKATVKAVLMLFPAYVAIIGLLLWKKFFSKNIRSYKSAVAMLAFLLLASGFAGHHWDLLMMYCFSTLPVKGVDLYKWTYDNSLFLRQYSINKHYFFPGYAYFPQMIPLFVAFYPLASAFPNTIIRCSRWPSSSPPCNRCSSRRAPTSTTLSLKFT